MHATSPFIPPEDATGATLTVDLAAVVENWRQLDKRTGPKCNTGAAVKADAYGLGADQVGPALMRAGCQTFYVADVGEGVRLRAALGGGPNANPRIVVFGGPLPGTEKLYLDHMLVPVINSLEQADRWRTFVGAGAVLHETVLHVDTGMNRLGFSSADFATLMADPDRTVGLFPLFLMTHLVSAERAGDDINTLQRDRFASHFGRFKVRFPDGGGSIANSAGIFLGPEFHLEYARPGSALYGVNPTPTAANPMIQTIRLLGRVLQVRTVPEDGFVGYGGTAPVAAGTRLATVGVGYADGYPRTLSNSAKAVIAGHTVPVVGIVSMDLIVLDISTIPESEAREGAMAELIGPALPVDDVATAAGTIGYEILTGLGRRYHRRYLRA